MSLDGWQREVLAAMGYTVYAVAGDEAAMPGAGVGAMAPSARAATNLDPSPLLAALLRAAGRDMHDAAAVALCRGLLPPGGLRDAQARRALWPRLRGLRARTAG